MEQKIYPKDEKMMRCFCLGLVVAASSPMPRIMSHEAVRRDGKEGERGFLLAAAGPVIDGLEILTLLEVICFSGEAATVVVETLREATVLLDRIKKICISSWRSQINIVYVAKKAKEESIDDIDRQAELRHYRGFKLNALATACPYKKSIYIDNDIIFRNGSTDALFERGFKDFKRNKFLSLGVAIATLCVRHSIPEIVPDSFCQRQGGVIFLRCDRKGRHLMKEWETLYHQYLQRDKHDQLSLRIMLYSRQNQLLNLPPAFNCRHPCKNKYHSDCLLYHAHMTKNRRNELDCFYNSSTTTIS